MNCSLGWRASSKGLSGFADEGDDTEPWFDPAPDYGSLPGYGGTPADDDSGSGIGTAALDIFKDLFKNVGQPALTNLAQSQIYGTPTGYVTVDGKQVPYWGNAAQKFTLNPTTGAQVALPSDKENKWLIPSILGGGILLLAFVMMKRK